MKFLKLVWFEIEMLSPLYLTLCSLRCQSLISLKLFKLKRNYCRQINNTCTEFFKSGKGDIINGNTPSSISPSNSVGSQVSFKR